MNHLLLPPRIARLVLAAAMLGSALAPFPHASAADGKREWVLRYGEAGDDYERIGLALRLGPLWSGDWGNWHAALRPELEASRFSHSGPAAGPDALYEVGGIGLLQLHYGERRTRPFVELGLGAALFSNDRLGGKIFSTHFQFSQHVTLGIEFARRAFAGLQYSHYSNADIDKPNDGIDLHQVVVGATF